MQPRDVNTTHVLGRRGSRVWLCRAAPTKEPQQRPPLRWRRKGYRKEGWLYFVFIG